MFVFLQEGIRLNNFKFVPITTKPQIGWYRIIVLQ